MLAQEASNNNWKNQDTTKLFKAILKLRDVAECEDFFRDLLTLAELKEISMRFKVARMLDEKKKPYLKIAKEAKTTTATVTRVAHWLKHGMGGYRLMLSRIRSMQHRAHLLHVKGSS